MTPDDTPEVERIPPTDPESESREETVERVVREEDLQQRAEPLDEDLVTARGRTGEIAARAAIAWVIGAAVGALTGWGVSNSPGPLSTESAAGTWGYIIFIGVAVGTIAAVVSTLLMLQREDGRVDDAVDQRDDTTR